MSPLSKILNIKLSTYCISIIHIKVFLNVFQVVYVCLFIYPLCHVSTEDAYERTLMVDGEETTLVVMDPWETDKQVLKHNQPTTNP